MSLNWQQKQHKNIRWSIWIPQTVWRTETLQIKYTKNLQFIYTHTHADARDFFMCECACVCVLLDVFFLRKEKCEMCSKPNVDGWIWALCITVHRYECCLMLHHIHSTHTHILMSSVREEKRIFTLRALVRFLWKLL